MKHDVAPWAGDEAHESPASPQTISRRTFVYGATGFVGLLALGGMAPALCGPAALVRPPGGTNEAEFLARCLRCDRCRSACPQNAIAPATLEDGLLHTRTPKMDFHLGACTYCGKCAEVCPTNALAPFSTTGAKTDTSGLEFRTPNLQVESTMGIAVVDQERCIAWDPASGGCRECANRCPYEAISLDASGRPVVDASLCNGCGLCENVCPSYRLRSYSAQDKRTLGINIRTRKEVQP